MFFRVCLGVSVNDLSLFATVWWLSDIHYRFLSLSSHTTIYIMLLWWEMLSSSQFSRLLLVVYLSTLDKFEHKNMQRRTRMIEWNEIPSSSYMRWVVLWLVDNDDDSTVLSHLLKSSTFLCVTWCRKNYEGICHKISYIFKLKVHFSSKKNSVAMLSLNDLNFSFTIFLSSEHMLWISERRLERVFHNFHILLSPTTHASINEKKKNTQNRE